MKDKKQEKQKKKGGFFKLYRVRIAAIATAITLGVSSIALLNSNKNNDYEMTEFPDTSVTEFDSSQDQNHTGDSSQIPIYNPEDNTVVVPPQGQNEEEETKLPGDETSIKEPGKVSDGDTTLTDSNNIKPGIGETGKPSGTEETENTNPGSTEQTETDTTIVNPHTHTFSRISEHYVDNGDGTHTLELVGTCPVDGESKILSHGIPTVHSLQNVYDEDGKLIGEECSSGCGYRIEKVHGHNYEISTTYEKINANTHRLVTTKTCIEPDCPEDERVIVEYGKPVSHSYLPGVKDPKTGDTIYVCKDCGHKRVVEKENSTTVDEHTHNYSQVSITYENMGEQGHRLVKTGICPRDGASTVLERGNVVSHTLVDIVENGTVVGGECSAEGCAYKKTYTKPPVVHTHNDTVTTSYEKTETTHTLITTHTCSDPNCPEKVRIKTGTTVGHNFGEEVTNPETGEISQTCADCGYKKVIENEKPPVVDPIRIDIESLISIDPNSLSFEYDGKSHSPIISGLPDNVTPRFVSVEGTDAGEYIWRIEFDVPEGYVADPIEISYEITPAQVSLTYQYNEETGEVQAIYGGIVSDDVLSKNYTVNGKEIDSSTLELDYGLSKVGTNIEINPDKLSNYTFSEDLSASALYEIKRENQWFEIETEYQEVDGKIVVELYFSNDKVPHYEDFIYSTLTFKIYFDESKLQFEDSTINEDLWEDSVIWNPYDSGKDPEGRDGIFNLFDTVDAPVTDRVKMGEFTLSYTDSYDKDKDKDLVISIYDTELASGHEDYAFTFTSDPSSVIINRSDKEISTTTKTNDLMNDATYSFEGWEGYEEEEELAKEMLQDYIDSGYEVPDDLKSIFGEEEDDEELEEENDTVVQAEEDAQVDVELQTDDVAYEEEVSTESVEVETSASEEQIETYSSGEATDEQTEVETENAKVYTLTYDSNS